MPTFCRLFICRPDLLPPFLLSLFICPPVSLPPPPSPSLCILQTFLNSFHCFFISSSSTLFHLPVLYFFTSSFFPSFLYLVTPSIHHLTFLSFFISKLFIFFHPFLTSLSSSFTHHPFVPLFPLPLPSPSSLCSLSLLFPPCPGNTGHGASGKLLLSFCASFKRQYNDLVLTFLNA